MNIFILFLVLTIIFLVISAWICVELKSKKIGLRLFVTFLLILLSNFITYSIYELNNVLNDAYGLTKEARALDKLVELTIKKLENGDNELILSNYKELDGKLYHGMTSAPLLEKINKQIINNKRGEYDDSEIQVNNSPPSENDKNPQK
ncbi:hypothetical protein AAEX28_14610 [Lentisphaerota bacterium WC36G]|nr:hypothetical protein LJT99_01365 [Lentisphaerae bacterium WC36]